MFFQQYILFSIVKNITFVMVSVESAYNEKGGNMCIGLSNQTDELLSFLQYILLYLEYIYRIILTRSALYRFLSAPIKQKH